jgi:hypothetical protein
LRQSLDELAQLTKRRAARVSSQSRATMSRHPWMTVGLGLLGGALLAIVATPSGRMPRRLRRMGLGPNWPSMPHMPTINVHPPHLPSRAQIGDYAERMADAITRLDPNAFSGEQFRKLLDTASGVWGSLKHKQR